MTNHSQLINACTDNFVWETVCTNKFDFTTNCILNHLDELFSKANDGWWVSADFSLALWWLAGPQFLDKLTDECGLQAGRCKIHYSVFIWRELWLVLTGGDTVRAISHSPFPRLVSHGADEEWPRTENMKKTDQALPATRSLLTSHCQSSFCCLWRVLSSSRQLVRAGPYSGRGCPMSMLRRGEKCSPGPRRSETGLAGASVVTGMQSRTARPATSLPPSEPWHCLHHTARHSLLRTWGLPTLCWPSLAYIHYMTVDGVLPNFLVLFTVQRL